MAGNKDTLAYQLKLWLLVYWLPSQAIAEAFPLIFGAYITILSLLRNLAASDSQNDLGNQTLFEQPGFEDQFYNYTEVAVGNYTISVSNAVLWVCREGSPDGEFYRALYRMAIGCLITFHLLTSCSRFFTAKFWFSYETTESGDNVTTTRHSKDGGILFITLFGAILLNLSFLLLLLSFDITPWSCISKPSTVYVEYISFSNRFDIQIQHVPSAVKFQQVASIFSFVLVFVWLVVRIVFFCRDVANENVEHRLMKYRDAPDIGLVDHDNELLDSEVNNVEETTEQDL